MAQWQIGGCVVSLVSGVTGGNWNLEPDTRVKTSEFVWNWSSWSLV